MRKFLKSSLLTLFFLGNLPVSAVELSKEECGQIARAVGFLLSNSHYKRAPLNDKISNLFLRNYMEALDYGKMVFLESDFEEFSMKYGNTLDNLTKTGKVSPAFAIHELYLRRLEQCHKWADGFLDQEFDYAKDETFLPYRAKQPWPASKQKARELWRKRIKYELLQDRLNKRRAVEAAEKQKTEEEKVNVEQEPDGKPEDDEEEAGEPGKGEKKGPVVKPYDSAEALEKIKRRYGRFLRTRQNMDSGDVMQFYLTALSNAYDPHSDYFSPREAENFEIQNIKLSLTGIGARLTWSDGFTEIVDLVPGGPASKSKQLKPGDRIITVQQEEGDPVDVVEMQLDEVVDQIRGKKGTTVRLTIIPSDATDDSETKVVSLVRDKIKLVEQLAKGRVIHHDVPGGKLRKLGVVDLSQFYENCARDVRLLLERFEKEKVEGLVLDLRRNGGGLLPEAVKLAGLFIEKGPMVQVIDSRRRKQVLRDKDEDVSFDKPMIVLVGKLSASASEIVAAALQDYGRALIVGSESTHGKGTVQTVLPLSQFIRLEDPGKLKFTVSKFYRIAGGTTQKQGVLPDLVLPSPYDYMEIGEAALPNCLPADHTDPEPYQRVNRLGPYLDSLVAKSAARIKGNREFSYVLEDIEILKRRLEDRSVSLNESKRLTEKDEEKARRETRKKERFKDKDEQNRVFELTLEMVKKNQPLGKKKESEEGAVEESGSSGKVEDSELKDEDGDEDGDEDSGPTVDPRLNETLNILDDYIRALNAGERLVANPPVKTASGVATLP